MFITVPIRPEARRRLLRKLPMLSYQAGPMHHATTWLERNAEKILLENLPEPFRVGPSENRAVLMVQSQKVQFRYDREKWRQRRRAALLLDKLPQLPQNEIVFDSSSSTSSTTDGCDSAASSAADATEAGR